MWIIFEGLDKTGKTTLERELLKETNFEHIVIDRGPAGYLAFDEIFKRETNFCRNQEFLKQAKMVKNSDDILVIYCTTEEYIAKRRLLLHKETCPYNYKNAQKIYEYNVNFLYDSNKLLILNTGDKNLKECIELIIEKIEELKGE